MEVTLTMAITHGVTCKMNIGTVTIAETNSETQYVIKMIAKPYTAS